MKKPLILNILKIYSDHIFKTVKKYWVLLQLSYNRKKFKILTLKPLFHEKTSDEGIQENLIRKWFSLMKNLYQKRYSNTFNDKTWIQTLFSWIAS